MNKEKIEKFDSIVIGSGQGGNPLVFELSSNNENVALIEERNIGGSCINVGCTPSKTLIESANLFNRIKDSSDLGIDIEDYELNFNQVINRKNSIVKAFREHIKKEIKNNKNIDLYMGKASFIDNKKIKVSLNNGEEKTLKADKIFINAGTSPRVIPIEGIKEIPYLNSTTIMDIDELPRHLIIIGTGYIGIEFAQMFRRFGSEVSVIGRSENIMKREDEDVSSTIQSILEDEGIRFYLESDTKKVSKKDEGIEVKIEKKDKKKTIKGSHLLLAVGQKPNTKDLELENTDIEVNNKGYIIENNKLETNVEGVYVLGDIKGGPKFTHIAYDDFRVIRDNLISSKNRDIKDRLIPYTLFTDPQLGRIGMTEREAKEQGYNYKVSKIDMSKEGRTIEVGKTRGFMKVIINEDNNQILGASILSYQGGEVMAMIEIAMMGHLPYQSLREGIFSHPTLSESLNNLFDI
mgnify:CR=1 FL=1